MVLSIYGLLESGLLVVNAIFGWGRHSLNVAQQTYGQQTDPSVKTQLLNMIHSIRTVMRVPLIFLNVIIIIFKIIFG